MSDDRKVSAKRQGDGARKQWLVLSLIALFTWGFWGLFGNLASLYLDSYSATFWESMGALIVGLFVLIVFLRGKNLRFEPGKGVLFSMLTGASYTIGLIFFFTALIVAAEANSSGAPTGHVHTILVVTGMYPVVAAIINYFMLDEPLSIRQLIGMGMAVIAIVVFATGNG